MSRCERGDMTDRTVLITGANSGIGKETARALAEQGATVVLACRSRSRGQVALDELAQDTGSERLKLQVVDLARLDDVRRAAREVAADLDHLDVLVNNAGFHTAHHELTEDGYESTFHVNHLAHYLLTHELMPLLAASEAARIVNVASHVHYSGKLRFDDLDGQGWFSGWRAYSQSKLANVVFSNELARRLEGTTITSNALHPGTVRSGFGRKRSGLTRIAVWLATPLMISPRRGARTPVHLASAPSVEGVSGRYFYRCRPIQPSKRARDRGAARRLWDVSAERVGVDPAWPPVG